jgi:hypothetical protein
MRPRSPSRHIKNKVQATTAAASSTAPGKRCRGRPLGSKNKKPSIATVCTSTTPDLGANHLILPQGSTGKVFFFFAFVDALCREWQRLRLKFAEFMDGREISHAIL